MRGFSIYFFKGIKVKFHPQCMVPCLEQRRYSKSFPESKWIESRNHQRKSMNSNLMPITDKAWIRKRKCSELVTILSCPAHFLSQACSERGPWTRASPHVRACCPCKPRLQTSLPRNSEVAQESVLLTTSQVILRNTEVWEELLYATLKIYLFSYGPEWDPRLRTGVFD